MAFFQFESGRFNQVDLKDVRFALATTKGPRTILYFDSLSDEPTRRVVKKIAAWILSLEGKTIAREVVAPIDLYLGSHFLKASIKGANTSIVAEPLVGNDGISSIIVARPWIFGVFPVLSTRKSIAQELIVSTPDHSFRYEQTNANDAIFEFCPDDVK